MSKTKIAILGLVALFVVFGMASCTYVLSVYNGASRKVVNYEMKLKDNNSEFDNMWKVISQTCQLADAKKDAFKEIFTGYAQARTPENAGKMMLWIKENAPANVDLRVFDNAQNIIVSKRDAFTMRQKELISIAEQYNLDLATMPRGAILSLFGFKPIDPKIVTSSRTEAAFATGKDDDTTLYKKEPATPQKLEGQ